MELTKNDVLSNWSLECKAAFFKFNKCFVTAPILSYFESDRETLIETNASDFALACILS